MKNQILCLGFSREVKDYSFAIVFGASLKVVLIFVLTPPNKSFRLSCP